MTRKQLIAAIATASAIGSGTAGAQSHPRHIDLPDGWQPEGIAAGAGHTLYVGSIPTGAVWRVNARTGAGREVVPAAEGRAAIGLKVDERGRLFVAGGPTGKVFVYDSGDGSLLEDFQLGTPGETFINDVTLTRRGAYFTDSRRAVLYFVNRRLTRATELDVSDIPLVGDFNLNGIAASQNGKTLLAVQSSTGRLWRIDARTGDAVAVDLGGATLDNGDGLLLVGRRLYVVRNRDNRIAVVKLSAHLRRGRVVRSITSDDFSVPTTVARSGGRLYAVNARFGTPATEDTDYWITSVKP